MCICSRLLVHTYMLIYVYTRTLDEIAGKAHKDDADAGKTDENKVGLVGLCVYVYFDLYIHPSRLGLFCLWNRSRLPVEQVSFASTLS